MPGKAIIIGGGIAGLSAAIGLRRAGWDAEVYEQAPALEPMGAGLSLWPNALEALAALGCADSLASCTVQTNHMMLARHDGRPILSIDVAAIRPGHCARMITRTDLQTVLLNAQGGHAVALDHALTEWGEDAAGVWARFANGHEARGDILIAADGIRSSIAAGVIGGAISHAGYGGVLALSGPLARAETGVEHWGRGERFGTFPITNGRSYWFYMRNEADASAAARLTHANVSAAMAGWAPAIRDVLAATPPDRLIPFSVHAKPPPARLGSGRIVCVGDAAHAMEPNLGQGACQALEDAVALGAAASGPDAIAILARFERTRLARVRRFVSLSKQGGLIAHRYPALLPLYASAPVSAVFGAAMAPVQRTLYRMPQYAT